MLLELHEKLQKNSASTFYSHSAFKQIEKVKKLSMWAPHKLIANQRNHHFEVLSSLTQQQRTISQSDCEVWQKWILHDSQR